MTPGARARSVLGSEAGRAGLALALVVAIGCVASGNGAFFRWSTERSMLREISVDGILACGMTVVIVAGGIDLSVGSVLALAAVVFAKLALQLGAGSVASIGAVLAVGALAGAINGALIARFRIQPFIVTLASMVFARGLAKTVAGGKKVTSAVLGEGGVTHLVPRPAVFDALDAGVLGDNVAIVTLVFFAVVAVTYVILERLRLGRYLYAVGGNAEAARLSGVPVGATLVAAYAFSGLCAGIAGICQAAQETHGDPEAGVGFELDAIAMVVIGGTSLAGGRGGVLLTLLGALTIGTLQKVLSINAFSTETRLMLTGAIIVGAVLFQRRGRP